MSLSERISGPLITLGEYKFVHFPKRESEFSTQNQVTVFREMAQGIREGKTMKSSDLVRQGILNGLPLVNPEELKNIPAEGGFVLAMNHYPGGVAGGTSQIMSVSYVIEEARIDRQIGNTIHDTTAYPRFIQAAQTGPKIFHFITEASNEQIGSLFGNFLVNRDGRKKKDFSHSLSRVLRHLKSGGVVGICPEGTMNYQLGQIDPRSIEFFDLVSRLGYPVLPAAAWNEGEQYHTRIGQLIRPQEEIYIPVMLAIESLLPLDKRFVWGFNPPPPPSS